MMDPEIQKALDDLAAAIHADVLILHLKIRRRDRALAERIERLENRQPQQLPATAPQPEARRS